MGCSRQTPAGAYFVDALWRAQGVVVEADGAAFHLSAEDWARDLVRQNALQAAGLLLLRYLVRRLRSSPVECGREIAATLS
ncbi:DUF559 domain-containing protein [Blastococcus sp. URHD0036]|uniref:DUF559 domain-containing protein n=1 Tax=Blastococcus sp. URHD0036 TaxID=1380356 RepID=UPI000496E4B0|nr:DUF559 domain-containing protein [Blastococcus sp. URHD0036]